MARREKIGLHTWKRAVCAHRGKCVASRGLSFCLRAIACLLSLPLSRRLCPSSTNSLLADFYVEIKPCQANRLRRSVCVCVCMCVCVCNVTDLYLLVCALIVVCWRDGKLSAQCGLCPAVIFPVNYARRLCTIHRVYSTFISVFKILSKHKKVQTNAYLF